MKTTRVGYMVSATLLAALALGSNFARADSDNPEDASKRCLRERPNKSKPMSAAEIRRCCDDALDGVKNEVSQCIKLATERQKNGPPPKSASSTSSKPSASPEANEGGIQGGVASPPVAQSAEQTSQAQSSGIGPKELKQGLDTLQGLKGLFR
jgi:hypothetical protein